MHQHNIKKEHKYKIPYCDQYLEISLPEEDVLFTGEIPSYEYDENWRDKLTYLLNHPSEGPSLASRIRKDQLILILVEDQTRHTPVKDVLPLLIEYLISKGVLLSQLEILICPGSHRILTSDELNKKLGSSIIDNIKVSQHDYTKKETHMNLGDIDIAGLSIPVHINKKIIDADLLIGIGNIIPHPNAGYSGGAKIVCPGCCGPETVSAMHTAAALLGYLPLGMQENACRQSLEEVASKAGLDFIINFILDSENRVIDLVTGDFIKAHRIGCELSKKIFGVAIKEEADILISCSYPYSSDYWQCEKAMISGYFAVKKGGILILPAPCIEGLAHNHNDLLYWLSLDSKKVTNEIRRIFSTGAEADLVAAAIAVGALTVKEKAEIFIYTDGLSDREINIMGYRRFHTLQDAVDEALRRIPGGKIGILPRGGDCLPYMQT